MSILEEIKQLPIKSLSNPNDYNGVSEDYVKLSDIERVLEKDWMICELCSLFAKCQIRKLFDLKYCSQFERE